MMNVTTVDFSGLPVSANTQAQNSPGSLNSQVSENSEQSFSDCLRSEITAGAQAETPNTQVLEPVGEIAGDSAVAVIAADAADTVSAEEIAELAFIYPKFGLVKVNTDDGDEPQIAEPTVFRMFSSKRAFSKAGTDADIEETAEGGEQVEADAERNKKTANVLCEVLTAYNAPFPPADPAAQTQAEYVNAPAPAAVNVPVISETLTETAAETSLETIAPPVPETPKPAKGFYGEAFAKDIVSVKAVKIDVLPETDELMAGGFGFVKPVIKESEELNELLTAKPDVIAKTSENLEKGAVSDNKENAEPEETEESEKTENSVIPVDREVIIPNLKELKTPALYRQITEPIKEAVTLLKTTGKTVTQFEITLEPEHLGKVTVKLIAKGAGVSVEIIADNPKTRELLAERMAAVRNSLENGGVAVEKYEVLGMKPYETEEKQRDFTDEGGNKQNQNQSNDDGKSDKSDDDENETSFADVVSSII